MTIFCVAKPYLFAMDVLYSSTKLTPSYYDMEYLVAVWAMGAT